MDVEVSSRGDELALAHVIIVAGDELSAVGNHEVGSVPFLLERYFVLDVVMLAEDNRALGGFQEAHVVEHVDREAVMFICNFDKRAEDADNGDWNWVILVVKVNSVIDAASVSIHLLDVQIVREDSDIVQVPNAELVSSSNPSPLVNTNTSFAWILTIEEIG